MNGFYGNLPICAALSVPVFYLLSLSRTTLNIPQRIKFLGHEVKLKRKKIQDPEGCGFSGISTCIFAGMCQKTSRNQAADFPH